jgi:hypothetical protein
MKQLMAKVRRVALAMLLACGLAAPAVADPAALDALVSAYPDQLAGHDGTDLIWRDGTRMALSEGVPATAADALIRHGSIRDQVSLSYPRGALMGAPQDDPGRIRNRAFFDKMYGDCRHGGVDPHLVPVVWLPKTWGRTLRVTSVNGVAAHLEAVSAELDALPPAFHPFLVPPGGTYMCRPVADLGQASMHGWGAAIDIGTAHADYWFWRRSLRANPVYANHIPAEIVDIFERHGFIWGGKWRHYDTMHFEYRPELLPSPP